MNNRATKRRVKCVLFDKVHWPHAAAEHRKCGWCELRCVVRVTYKADSENSEHTHKKGCEISH